MGQRQGDTLDKWPVHDQGTQKDKQSNIEFTPNEHCCTVTRTWREPSHTRQSKLQTERPQAATFLTKTNKKQASSAVKWALEDRESFRNLKFGSFNKLHRDNHQFNTKVSAKGQLSTSALHCTESRQGSLYSCQTAKSILLFVLVLCGAPHHKAWYEMSIMFVFCFCVLQLPLQNWACFVNCRWLMNLHHFLCCEGNFSINSMQVKLHLFSRPKNGKSVPFAEKLPAAVIKKRVKTRTRSRIVKLVCLWDVLQQPTTLIPILIELRDSHKQLIKKTWLNSPHLNSTELAAWLTLKNTTFLWCLTDQKTQHLRNSNTSKIESVCKAVRVLLLPLKISRV